MLRGRAVVAWGGNGWELRDTVNRQRGEVGEENYEEGKKKKKEDIEKDREKERSIDSKSDIEKKGGG